MSNDLAVVLLTYNEELHLERALKSVASISNEIYIIDSYSTDRTVEIAKKYGACVLQNKFVNYAKQFQWGLDNAPIKSTWVMRLDADEIIEPDLQATIKKELPTLNNEVTGINLKRKHIFMDRWVKYGGRYPLVLLRIWRRGQARIEDRWMDEHMVVWGGKTVTFEGGFADHNLKDLSFFTHKHNWYANREAVDVLNQRLDLFPRDPGVTSENSSFQASFKRLAKENLYNRLPFTVSSLGYFLYRYFLQFGFLDGRSGLVYHFLQGFWYRFLVGAKIMEFEKAINHLTDKDDIRKELAKVSGLDFSFASKTE